MDRAKLRDLAGYVLPRLTRAGTHAGSRPGRFLALSLLAAIIVLEGMTSSSLPIASGDETGTLTVTPPYANSGKTITVVVDDESPATSVLHESESTDFTGNPYTMPAGAVAEQHIFRVKNGPIADLNGDGKVDGKDLVTSLDNVSLDWLNTQNGTFAVTQYLSTSAPINFDVTYRHEVVDTTTVAVRSSSDIDGFNLTLQETGPATNIYTATLITGTETSTTNISSPTATTRPVIKVVDAGIVTVEYADAYPATLVSDAVIIDTTVPVLEVEQLPNGVTTSNAQNWATVNITDDRSGIDLSDITFNVDLNRNGVFGESGEVISPSEDFSTEINQGWSAFALLPGMSDGNVAWYATATDRAGNTARTDSDTATSGSQNHTFEIDTTPPQVVDVLLGDDYEEAKTRAVTNQPNKIRVDFTEPIDPDSVVAGRFLFGSLAPVSAVVYEDVPDAVFLTYEDLPSIAEPMQILAGAVTDLLGLNSERHLVPTIDHLGPTLEVLFDTVITRDKVTITSRSPEALATPPTVEINGVTFGIMTATENEREWTIDVDADLLIGAAAGDGVKNVEIAGFDRLGNQAHGGVRREDPAWPQDAHLFELDRNIKLPVILPAANDTVTVVDPVITVSYAAEASEYPGDTHGSVTVISAKLDGFDVTSLMKATTASSWTFQPGSLEPGAHEFVIQSRDDAGNVHGTPVLRFIVDPPPTPTPEPTLQPTPEPTEIPIEGPGATPPANLIGTPTPEPTAAPTAEPTATPETPTPEPTATPPADTSPTPTPEQVDIEATVQAIRNGDGSGDTGNTPVSNKPSGYTLYGCSLPIANAGVAGGDYALMGFGLVGLVVMSRKRKSSGGKKPEGDREDSL